jgi:hypothetical protein
MAYGALRLLAQNKITAASMITLSSQETGRTSGTLKVGDGVAVLTVSGTYAAARDLAYTLEIDSVTGGVEVGQATFKWRTNQSGVSTWEETGVLTATTPAYALSADGEGSGLSVAFTGGVGDDFALADYWQWHGQATYGPEKLLDHNPMTVWRSNGDTSATITVDLGSDQLITAFILAGHNLTSGAIVTLSGNTTNAFVTPAYTTTLTPITDPLYLYLSQTYRYWQISIADASNPDSYLEAASLVMGEYVSLEQPNATWGSAQVPGLVAQKNSSQAGVSRDYYYATQNRLSLALGNGVSNNDIDTLIAVRDVLLDTITRQIAPLWVHLFYDEADTLWLMRWTNIDEWQRVFAFYLGNSGITMELAEVVSV